MKLGFVGLGVMGIRMLRNLIKRGYAVTAYDVRKEAIEEAAKTGALTAISPKEVALNSEVVLLSLPSSPEVKEVIFGHNGIVEAAEDVIIVNLSTMDPEASVEIEARLKQYGNIRFLDVPVSGGSFGAEEGTLTLIMSGNSQVIKEVEGILKSIGQEMVYTGAIGTAQVMKLANNAMAAVNTMAMAEAFTWAMKQSVNPEVFLDMISKSSGDSWALRNRLPKIIKRDFEPGFSVRLMHKDVSLFLKSAAGLFTPFASLACNFLQTAKDKGFEDDDYGVITRLYEEGTRMSEKERLFSSAEKFVKTCVDLRPDDTVCIVTDTNKLAIAEALAAAAKRVAAETVIVAMTPRKMHGNEPPEIVAGAMREATVIFTPVTYAITHTEPFKEALKAGARAIVLRGVTEDMMIHGAINANYQEIRQKSEILANFLREASDILITSTFGTNLQIKIKDRPVFVLGGFAEKPGTFAAMPDGEVALSPIEGTAMGVVVFDRSMDGIGALASPIRLDVERGKVIKISGGHEAEALKKLIEGAGECGFNIAEFAIGTNPMARLIGNLAEDKKKEGTAHIAIGDNHNLGGKITCNIHLDGLMTTPIVEVNGKTIVDRGQVTWDHISEYKSTKKDLDKSSSH